MPLVLSAIIFNGNAFANIKAHFTYGVLTKKLPVLCFFSFFSSVLAVCDFEARNCGIEPHMSAHKYFTVN